MARAQLVPLSGNYRTGSSLLTLVAATTLTTTATTLTTDWVDVNGWEYLVFHLKYVKGSETTARFLPVWSDDESTWRPLGIRGPVSSGLSAATKDVTTLTPADWSATDYVTLPPVNVIGLQYVAAYYYYNGGAAPGTLEIKVTGGCQVSARR